MGTHTPRLEHPTVRCASFFVFSFATPPQLGLALDPALVGKWSSGTGVDTALMEIKAYGSAVMDGAPLKLQAEGGKIKFIYQPGIVIDATQALNGSTLTVTVVGETET